ncbi:hypothetical protein HGRIS_003432 [Hohenbuehelia grisea]|uniref:Uncharacterized protein n=1 Tax=Hohenbuehelia grisea TaxID=104357 RepID=A0ABR3JFW1_9AGAR
MAGVSDTACPLVRQVRCFRYKRATGQTVTLVGTPGFDETTKSDTEILDLLAKWLQKTHRNHVRLTGVIYTHRITDNRMTGAPIKNLPMFSELCGDEAARGVVLATTMWGKLKSPEVGTKRLNELLKTTWKPMIESGSCADQFLDGYQSAWNIIDLVIERWKTRTVLLQEEMVNLKKRLGETSAGDTLYAAIQEAWAGQREILQGLRERTSKLDNPDSELVRHLEAQYNKLQERIDSTFEQMIKMKIPLTRRIILFFSFKSAKPNGIPVWKF